MGKGKGQGRRRKCLNRSNRSLAQRKRREAEKAAELLSTEITDTPR